MSLIEVKHLRKEYGDVVPLKDVNATVDEGEVISIIGPSGTGKSTFIRCLNRLETPTSGQILVDGVDIREYDLRYSSFGRTTDGEVFLTGKSLIVNMGMCVYEFHCSRCLAYLANLDKLSGIPYFYRTSLQQVH